MDLNLPADVERITRQYLDEGYELVLHPTPEQLPPFPGRQPGFAFLATRGNERVLVELKQTRSELEADPDISRRAEVVNAEPGWRYDVVVLKEGNPVQRITRGSREPTDQEVEMSFAEVETLVSLGQHRAALVLAWGVLEAAMRHTASAAELYMPKSHPSELMRTLYGNGVLTQEEFQSLRESYRLRTEIVHGLVSPPVSGEVVRAVVSIARSLVTGLPAANGIAG